MSGIVVVVVALSFGAVFLLLGEAERSRRTKFGFIVKKLRGTEKALSDRFGWNIKTHNYARQLPHMLDMIILGLLAGLSFDGALELYCKHNESALSQEVKKMQYEWRIGIKDRKTALFDFAETIGSSSFKQFAISVVEALELGCPLSETLEVQADVIRQEQCRLIKERIEKLPVQMLVPMGVLVVPAMLLAILGPMFAGAFG